MSASDLHLTQHNPQATGPRVILVHGAPDRSRSFGKVVNLLNDVRLTTYDRRGYGLSTAAVTGGGGFHTHARDLIEILEAEPAVVVGQSAGGAVAMLAATQRPELFLSLGMWEPPMVPWEWWAGKGPWDHTIQWAMFTDPTELARNVNLTIIGEERWNRLPASTRERLLAEGVAFRQDMVSQHQPYLDPADVTVKSIIGSGTVFPVEELAGAHERLASRIGASVFVVEGADHFSHTTHPQAWEELVRRSIQLAEDPVS